MSSAFIQKRFSTSSEDAEGRLHHWAKAVRLMPDNLFADLFGMGLGSYPRHYATGSTEKEHPSDYRYERREGDNTCLRLPSGGFLYLDQRVALRPDSHYVLKMDLRSKDHKARLTTPVCEKSFLHSFNCEWIILNVGTKGGWEHHEKKI
jgi:hypothetical protein